MLRFRFFSLGGLLVLLVCDLLPHSLDSIDQSKLSVGMEYPHITAESSLELFTPDCGNVLGKRCNKAEALI